MSIFTDMFKPVAPVAPAPAANPTPAQPAGTSKVADATPTTATVSTPGTAPNGVVPDNVNTPQLPLDKFADVWETDPNAKPLTGDYKPEAIDPAKLQEIMKGVDLKSVVTPEQQAAIAAGGEEATSALLEAMNTVAQQTMYQSTLIANKIQEQNTVKLQEAIKAQLPAMLKGLNLSSSLNESNPVYSHKAVAPVMEALQATLTTKYPNATTAELTKMTQEFVKAMGETFNPAAPAPTPKGETDWSAFLETPQE